jgi:omega-6 fatty acid desaturase (delta-12 desaturase)
MVADAGSGKLKIAKPDWYQAIAEYAHPNLNKSLWQVVDTFVPYALVWAAMLYTVRQGYPYWVTLALTVLAGGILVRVFILFHDCCHGSFFRSRRANTILGYVSGILTFTPYEDWRYAHNIHHATAGDIDRQGVGDIWTMTKEEYLAAPRRKQLGYRLYRSPFILFIPGPAFLFLFIQRFSTRGAGKKERRSVLLTNLALLAIVALASSTIGFQAYLSIQLPTILIASTFGLWLFYVQHQFESVYWAPHEFWDPMQVALEGSSYYKLPKILQWFSGNIGLHHVHHARPTIPNYNLQQCHDDIAAFQAVEPLTIRTGLKSLRLSLYDTEQKKMIDFRALKPRPLSSPTS